MCRVRSAHARAQPIAELHESKPASNCQDVDAYDRSRARGGRGLPHDGDPTSLSGLVLLCSPNAATTSWPRSRSGPNQVVAQPAGRADDADLTVPRSAPVPRTRGSAGRLRLLDLRAVSPHGRPGRSAGMANLRPGLSSGSGLRQRRWFPPKDYRILIASRELPTDDRGDREDQGLAKARAVVGA